MTSRTQLDSLRFVVAAAAVYLVFVLLGSWPQVVAQSQGALTPAERRGKQIYLKGGDGERAEITALLGSDALEVPATAFTCANCHGVRGEGTKEGGLQPPPIDWETLTRASTSVLTRRQRQPYDEATLARAISTGVDPAGARLHPGMPQYAMTAAQMSDLIAYLRKLGKEADAEPGITESSIKVGAALPLTGALAQIGEDIRATLAASFAEVNARGGIYGRRFELLVEDSKGEPAQTLEATRRLVEQQGVFVMVGSFEPGESRAVNELIRQRAVPLVGPVTLSPRLSLPPNPYVFYLLPTFVDQARSLVDFVRSRAAAGGTRLAVVYAEGDFNRDALDGLKSQAKLYGMELVSEQGYVNGRFSAATAVASLARAKPNYIFFFGGADDINALAREMERAGLKAGLLSSVVMVGRGAFTLPASVAAETYLSYPAALPNQDDFAEFISTTQKAGVALRSPAFQSVAYAASKVLFEAVKLGGRQLDRATLVGSLEQLRDFQTGVVPPVTFSPNRRVGSVGSYIVGIDLAKRQYMPLTERLTPKDKP